MGVAPFTLGDFLRLGRLGVVSFPTPGAVTAGQMIWDQDNNVSRIGSSVEWRYINDGPATLTSLPAGVVAVGTLGGGALPTTRAFTVQGLRGYISVAGTGGSTNATIRVSGGGNDCDMSFACNTGVQPFRATASGGCTFSTGLALTYSVLSAGDCTGAPTLLGTIDIEGFWR